MNATKRMKSLGLFVLVVAVSVATNLTTNLVSHKNEGFNGQDNSLPAGYARSGRDFFSVLLKTKRWSIMCRDCADPGRLEL